MRFVATLLGCLLLAACTTTNSRIAAPAMLSPPAANATVLVVQPDAQIYLLTAAGLQEAREDWSRSAQSNLAKSLDGALSGRSHKIEMLDPAASMEGRTGQLLRLHQAVGLSIQTFEYGPFKLPTKKGGFDWTLGEGATELRAARGADYALFITARGSYASAGRKAVMVGAAILGVGIPLGSQQVYASLVDLRTGRVIWFNVALAGPSADMRTPEGAGLLVTDLLKGAPL